MPLAPLAPLEPIQRYMSTYGISTWADHDRDGTDDDDVLEDCQSIATQKIVSRLRRRYLAASLYTTGGLPINAELQECAVVIALRHLCLRRGNPVPESLEYVYEQYTGKDGWLDRVVKGKEPLVDEDGGLVEQRKGIGLPTFSNLTIDRRYGSERVRVMKQSSSNNPTSLEQDTAVDRGVIDG